MKWRGRRKSTNIEDHRDGKGVNKNPFSGAIRQATPTAMGSVDTQMLGPDELRIRKKLKAGNPRNALKHIGKAAPKGPRP